jgi:hypothetical protein
VGAWAARQRLRELFTLTAHNDSTTPARSMSGGGGGEASSRGEGGAVLDGPRFSRLLRDAGLVGRTLTRDSVDVIFAKVRPHQGYRGVFLRYRPGLPVPVSGTLAACKGPKSPKFLRLVPA